MFIWLSEVCASYFTNKENGTREKCGKVFKWMLVLNLVQVLGGRRRYKLKKFGSYKQLQGSQLK